MLGAKKRVDNRIYQELGDRWYGAQDDPVALLRAEAKLRNPWIASMILNRRGDQSVKLLDLGCGGGLLSNWLAAESERIGCDWQITGVDLAEGALRIARLHDETGGVNYQVADAAELPFADHSFDVVCAMDLLEHVEEPGKVLLEAARVLRPRGMFFFNTFNRTPLSALTAIYSVRWFVKNTPRRLHVYRMFIKPEEMMRLCRRAGLRVEALMGVRPVFQARTWLRLASTREVPRNFEFEFCDSLRGGYCGVAFKSMSVPRKGE